MTLDELFEIKSALEFSKHVDSCLDECEEALRIINREINLKTMDPRFSASENEVIFNKNQGE